MYSGIVYIYLYLDLFICYYLKKDAGPYLCILCGRGTVNILTDLFLME